MTPIDHRALLKRVLRQAEVISRGPQEWLTIHCEFTRSEIIAGDITPAEWDELEKLAGEEDE